MSPLPHVTYVTYSFYGVVTLKLPFFNRKRYIELKCYSAYTFDVDNCPITLSSKLPAMKSVIQNSSTSVTFATCYGDVKGLKKSAVLPSWTEIEFDSNSETGGIEYRWADQVGGLSTIKTHHDPVYTTPNSVVTKICSPWRIEETTGVHFVVAKHIRNRTPMAIPSGVQTFNRLHELNVFNLVPNNQPKYKIPFKEPLVAVYPMSDLPLHVECIYDEDKHNQLTKACTRKAHFRGNDLKLSKNKY